MTAADAFHSDPETMGGTPVFVGTRVPVYRLLDYITGGETLATFLDQYPGVSRAQALAALDWMRGALTAYARAA